MKAQTLTLPLKALLSFSYIEVLKPKETSLIAFTGIISAFLAGGGQPIGGRFLMAVAAIILGTAGANALTNYLDREVDSKMRRTYHRALPSGRIQPAEKVILWGGAWVLAGLILAWLLNPWAFLIELIGVIASLIYRKTVFTHFLGSLAGTTPVLIGWLSIAPIQPTLIALALLVFFWQPLHIWSLMLAYREDYLGAGIRYFPLNLSTNMARVLFSGLSLSVYLLSLLLYQVADLGLAYLVSANVLGGALLLATFYWLRHPQAQNALRLFRIATFPYLGLLLLVLVLERW
ncbi:MAG: protoheme IX farnesyltransferase, partial [Chloroflexota bacterium]